MGTNPVLNILLENATSFAERKDVLSLTEAEAYNVNNNMVAKLFQSTIDKAHVDYEDIPASKGDITKYTGYKSMVESLDLLSSIAEKANHKIPEVNILRTAVSNIVAYRDHFEKGIKLNKDFIVLEYNTLVAMCVIGTSAVIASYIDYIRRIDTVEFKIINPKEQPGSICIQELEKFNRSVKSGEFSKVINSIIKSGTESFTGAAVLIPIAIIGGAIALTIGLRLMTFYIYNIRMKLSNYLKLQALFLELNRNNIMAGGSNVPPNKKEAVLREQKQVIDSLLKISDKIKVEDKIAVRAMNADIKKENSEWKLDNVRSEIAHQDQNGFQLI